MNLDAQKTINEIDKLIIGLKNALKKKSDFKELHQDTLRICKIIFNNKSDYKIIDIRYPQTIQFVWEDGTNVSRLPDKKYFWDQKAELLKNTIKILNEAHKSFSLKLKLQDKKQESFIKTLNEIKKDIKEIKRKINS